MTYPLIPEDDKRRLIHTLHYSYVLLPTARLRASAAALTKHFWYLIKKLYGCNIRLHRSTLAFLSLHWFKNCSGQWSVMISNCRPYKYVLSWSTVQTRPSHSFSIVEYRVSRSSNLRLINKTGWRSPLLSGCVKTAPIPCPKHLSPRQKDVHSSGTEEQVKTSVCASGSGKPFHNHCPNRLSEDVLSLSCPAKVEQWRQSFPKTNSFYNRADTITI